MTPQEIRIELYKLHDDPDVAEHVRHAAAVLINWYGSLIDAEMMAKAAAKEMTK